MLPNVPSVGSGKGSESRVPTGKGTKSQLLTGEAPRSGVPDGRGAQQERVSRVLTVECGAPGSDLGMVGSQPVIDYAASRQEVLDSWPFCVEVACAPCLLGFPHRSGWSIG